MIQLIPAEDVASISKWVEVIKSYRYEMKPTKNQEVKLIKTLEILRHLYNWSFGERKEGWKNGGWSVQYNDQQNYLTVLRNKNDDFGKELRNVYTDVEQNQLKRVDFAYERYFERVKKNKMDPKKYKKPGYPRPKGRNRMKSFTFPRHGFGCDIVDKYGNKNVKGDFIRLSKIGTIPFIKHKEIEEYGEEGISYWIKTVTVKREVDKWIFIPVISTFVEIEIPVIYNKTDTKVEEKEIKTIEDLQEELKLLNDKCIGNDMGMPNLITNSNGKKIEAPKYLEKSAKRLRKEQQKLARKKIYDELDINGKVKRDPKTGKKLWNGSKNRDKQVTKVAKVHRHIKNQRRDFDHCISKTLKNDNDLNVFEKLPIQKMMKDRRYSKGIADSGWGQVQRFTSYKAEWAGKMVDFVDPVYTSQVCSRCGRLVGRVEEGEIFECPFCGLIINVHVNAGINIRNRSEIYRELLGDVYQKLSKELKEKIRLSEERLSSDILSSNIYCWSKDPEDSWSNDRISRDAAVRIYAFGEVASTHIEIYERVTSMNKEALSNKKGGSLIDTKLQAPPFRAE